MEQTLEKRDINASIITSNLYRIIYKAIDKAWNIKTITRDFIWDIVNPWLVVTNQNWTYFKDSLNIS